MNWVEVPQFANILLGAGLAARLLGLKLHRVYSIFAIFVVFDVLQSIVQVLVHAVDSPRVDYRIVWMVMRPIAWVLSLWIVYSLLAGILRKLPGISRLSRLFFRCIFLGAAVVAVLSAIPLYLAMGGSKMPPLDQALVVGLALERAMSMAGALVLLLTLGFILWFPVQMPRNLAIFSIGFVIYFCAQTALLLVRTYLPVFYKEHSSVLAVACGFLLLSCFVYWLLFISSAGEQRDVRIGHSWEAAGQLKLIGQLEAMNAALLASRPLKSQ